MEPLLQVRDLAVSFSSGRRRQLMVLRGLSFDIAPGEAVGLLGESGCGKTTLALSLLHLLPPAGRVESGSIIFRGVNLTTLPENELQKVRGAGISLVHQEPGMVLNPVIRVGKKVVEVLRAHRPLSRDRAREEANALLRQVGLSTDRRIDEAYPHQLSGGQQQRVVIAQAIACQPALIIADEPTTALDPPVQLAILELVRSLRESIQLALLLISHHPGVLAQAADRILVMYAGRFVEEGPTRQVFREPLHPYTRGLLQSGLANRPKREQGQPLTPILGNPPDFADLAGGCAFHPRCPDRMEVCRACEPTESWPAKSRRVSCFKFSG